MYRKVFGFVTAIVFSFAQVAWAADNIAVTAGSGETVAFDDISSAKYQRIKLIHGADGVNAGDVSSANPLPIESELMTAATLADGANAAPSTTTVGAIHLLMNASTADRQRAVVNGLDSTGTGIAASGLVCQLDDTSTGTVTENQFAPVRMSSRRALLVEGVASGTAIGTTVSSIVPGTGATNLGKAEDAAHSSGDTAVPVLAVRNDGGSVLAGTDGDYVPLSTDSSGNLRVTGGGGGSQYTEADTDTTITGTAILWEDASDTLRAVSSAKPLPIDITDTTVAATQSGTWTVQPGNTANTTPWLASVHDGTNKASVRDTGSSDSLNVSIVDGSGNQVTSFGSGTQYDEDAASAGGEKVTLAGAVRQDTIASSLSADGDIGNLKVNNVGRLYASATIDAALPAGNNNIGDVDVASIAAGNNNIGDVDVASIAAGNNNIGDVDVATLPDATVIGKAAHDAAVSGNPVLLGGYASAAAPTDVSADGDVARIWTTVKGAVNVADAGGSLTVDNGGTFAVQAAQSGTWTVQPGNTANTTPWLASIHDGTNKASVRDTGSSDSVNVSIVDASGNQITTFGGGTQYTEDAAAAADPVGTALNLIRKDALAALTSADGDNVAARGTDKGELYVKHADSIAVTNAGTFVTQVDGSALTALQLIDDPVRSEDEASADTHKGFNILAVRKASPANTSGTDGDYESLQMSAGRLWTSATIDAALPAGTNAIGKLAANSGVDIGDVDVASVVPGTGATNLGKAEDAAHTTGDTIVPIGAVRVDSAAALAGTDQDYSPLQVDANGALRVTGAGGGTQYTEDAAAAADPIGTALNLVRTDTLSGTTVSADGDNITARGTAKGELYVKQVDSVTVTDGAGALNTIVDSGSLTCNAGTNLNTSALATQATLASLLTSSELIDDTVIQDDLAFTPGTTKVQMAGFQLDNTAPNSVNEGDAGAARMSANRNIYVNIRDADGNERGLAVDASGQIAISGITAGAAVYGANAHDVGLAYEANAIGGVASAAAPTSVDTDGDFVRGWFLRNGAQAHVLTAAGALIGGDATNGLDVDVTRVTGTVTTSLVPATSGGLTIYRNLDIDETGVNIKASAGQIYGYFLYNNASTTRFVKFYNKATAPTVGTDTPVITLPIPPYGAANWSNEQGVAFGTGIGIGCVTGVADSSTGAPAANDCVVNVYYK